jgi:hypothetical protein
MTRKRLHAQSLRSLLQGLTVERGKDYRADSVHALFSENLHAERTLSAS